MLGPPSSQYREYPAAAGLDPWIACTWSQAIGDGDSLFLQRVLPDGCADILWIAPGPTIA